MYFGLSEEQKSLEENINRFLEDNASLDVIKAVANGESEKAQQVHQGIIDLGLSGLVVPEEYGGLELNMLFATVVASALGSGTAPVPYAGSYVMAPIAINLGGDEQQKSNWLPKIAGGECVIGVGLSEYVGAREDSGIEFSNGKLSGRCLFLIDGKDADAYLLADKSGQLYLVDSSSSGITVTELTTVDKTRTSIELVLDKVDAEILPNSSNREVIEKVLDAGRLMLAADTVGAAQVMLDKSVAYSLERKQFGRLIGSFQAWKEPINLPNCFLSKEYATDLSSITWAAPTVSAANINLPASSTFSITSLLLELGKISASTLSRTNSIEVLVLSTVVSSVTVIPELEESTKYNCPDLSARR